MARSVRQFGVPRFSKGTRRTQRLGLGLEPLLRGGVDPTHLPFRSHSWPQKPLCRGNRGLSVPGPPMERPICGLVVRRSARGGEPEPALSGATW
jgi:hypothetical protein